MPGGYVVRGATGMLTKDERRTAINVARLSVLLGKMDRD
jgi:hypothetical protein